MPKTHTHTYTSKGNISRIELDSQADTNAQEQDPDAYAQLMGWLPEASKGCNEIEHWNK